MTSMARFVAANLSKAGYMPCLDQAATILATSLAMVVAWVNSPTDYVPRPSFPEPVLEGQHAEIYSRTGQFGCHDMVGLWLCLHVLQ